MDEFARYTRSLLASWEALAAMHGSAAVRRSPDADVMTHAYPVLNNALVRSPAGVALAGAAYGGAHHALWTHDAGPALASSLVDQGYVEDERTTAMLLDLHPDARAPREPDDLRVDADPARVGALNGLPNDLLGPAPGVRGYTALGGAAGLLTVDTADDVNVSCVFTRPEHRRRGHARALLAVALRDANRRGLSGAALQATPDGLGLYTGLGFRAVGTWQEWVRG